MHIRKGSLLGPYEIVAPIGAGGMGEVWKARDTRLDRSVAIKVLPRRVRYRREDEDPLRARGEDDLAARASEHLPVV